MDVHAFSARWRAVGAKLQRLERAAGEAAAPPHRARHLAISYLDALRVASLRRDAYRSLAALARDMDAAAR